MPEQLSKGTAIGAPINRFFSKIYIINLDDSAKRFNKVTKQFVRNGVKYARFPAVDGRCDDTKRGICAKKRRELEKEYNVNIDRDALPAAAALCIGTREILKDAIKHKYKRILICEDDIVFGRNMIKNFATGVKELSKSAPDWDLLYLGVGGKGGVRGISKKKTTHNKYLTSLSIVKKKYNWYVHHKDDLRGLCSDGCEVISDHLSIPQNVSGTWCYAFTLKAAKKVYKRLKNIDGHIDHIVDYMTTDGELKAVVFDPPIVWHEAGAYRPDSTIPWDW